MARDQIETTLSNMLDPEFKATIIKTLAALEKSIKDIKESLTAEVKDQKTSQAEIKNSITDAKSTGGNDHKDERNREINK